MHCLMNQSRIVLIAVSVALAITSSAALAADPQVGLGAPTYSGSGCPEGSVSYSLSPDASALSLIYDRYVAEAGGSTRVVAAAKGCMLSIPLRIPRGYMISEFTVDHRGFSSIPEGGSGTLLSTLNFTGKALKGFPVSTQVKSFRGPATDGDYQLTHRHSRTYSSSCGGTASVQLWTSLLVNTNRAQESAMLALDTDDVASQTFKYRLVRCRPLVPPGRLPTAGNNCLNHMDVINLTVRIPASRRILKARDWQKSHC